MSGAELKDMDYPRKSPGKSYLTFKIEEFVNESEHGINSLNISNILSKLDNHVNGTPVFIESEHAQKLRHDGKDL